MSTMTLNIPNVDTARYVDAANAARAAGIDFDEYLRHVIDTFAQRDDIKGRVPHTLPTDTVLHTDEDFDAFEHEVLGDA
ncbi:hypothetical protein [Bifidobacterium simiarum]|uniref:Uncharacterized protein n=1 Tax=Bifidobacterium simiarum TaxID=2045441 RepID=A0A2M9HDT0_9BIFI|nr:hypothetical protein [Bifidobacterium simiarum]MBT1166875.1 hypothetical protein [Bifidobacterium simiarum]PJM74970.1 hypothetical protein CSQ87_06985 [Bifidobacterium simiarum]